MFSSRSGECGTGEDARVQDVGDTLALGTVGVSKPRAPSFHEGRRTPGVRVQRQGSR